MKLSTGEQASICIRSKHQAPLVHSKGTSLPTPKTEESFSGENELENLLDM